MNKEVKKCYSVQKITNSYPAIWYKDNTFFEGGVKSGK
jgi:hypothetical protein